ncbi:MAG: exodeoxyribonuclease VII large subunit [Bacilli bacterium]|nr:exodeoxyribonuclease VII large subunit [Bacilli bacterium]
MNNDYITVTQLTRYIKYKIDNDSNLNKIYLKGEISNFKAHTRGHFYFTLKDENSRINAVMFSTYAKDVKFDLQDGMKVLVTGRVSVYEATGGYQIYVDSIVEDGLGKLYIAFEQLKKKLDAEGLFLESHKKKIPRIPNRIGIITAPTGAAIKDILSTLKRRWPLCETILFPSLVQGAEAAVDIVRNIELSKNYDLDLLIIGRGGGSIEDLWCFNEEIVARAIYALDTPVISAVGHEIDYTISDYVADLRAPTPTGAAEMAVPDIKDITKLLNQFEIRAINGVTNIHNLALEKLAKLDNSFVLKNPITIYQIKEDKFDNLYERVINSYKNIITNNKNKLELVDHKLINGIKIKINKDFNDYNRIKGKLDLLNPVTIYNYKNEKYINTFGRLLNSYKVLISNNKNKLELIDNKLYNSIFNKVKMDEKNFSNIISKLEALNPLLTIKRGYSIIRKDDKVISSSKDLKKYDKLELEMHDGKVKVEVL